MWPNSAAAAGNAAMLEGAALRMHDQLAHTLRIGRARRELGQLAKDLDRGRDGATANDLTVRAGDRPRTACCEAVDHVVPPTTVEPFQPGALPVLEVDETLPPLLESNVDGLELRTPVRRAEAVGAPEHLRLGVEQAVHRAGIVE